jgi:hypothetical protein
MLLSAIQQLINYTWNKEELPGQWKESIIVLSFLFVGLEWNQVPCCYDHWLLYQPG